MVAGARGGSLVLLLALACISDWRTRRIPNQLVALLALGGFAFAFLTTSSGAGIPPAAPGGGVGPAILLPFFSLRTLWGGRGQVVAASSALSRPAAPRAEA